MSYSESKTFSRIKLPEGICPMTKHQDFVTSLAVKAVKEWFSGAHFLDGCCEWDYIADEYGNSGQSEFANTEGAYKQIKDMIEECLAIRRSISGKGADFQVYRDTDTYGDEVHDWILNELLQDSELALESVKCHCVVEDSKEGMSVCAYLMNLNDSGELVTTSID
jgi:hypothetical protein